MIVHGFTVCTGKEDIFVKSDRKNITDSAVIDFINRYQNFKNRFACVDEAVIKWTKWRMTKATYELVTTDTGFKYHKIACAGCETCIPVDDKSAVIIL